MRTSDLVAIGLACVAVVALGRFSAPSGDVAYPEPPAAAREAVAPVTARLAGHPDEAEQLARFYHDAADALRRDGAGAKVLTSTAHVRTFCERAVTLRFQGTFQKVPGLTDAIHGPEGAFAQLLALDVTELDHAKAADAFDAVAWACREAAR